MSALSEIKVPICVWQRNELTGGQAFVAMPSVEHAIQYAQERSSNGASFCTWQAFYGSRQNLGRELGPQLRGKGR